MSWECVHFGSADTVDALRADLADIALVQLDGAALDSKDALLSQLASAFQFPSYFGHNWDSVEECLRDLDWLPASGYVLLIHDATAFWQSSPQTVGTLIEIWLSAAEWWSRFDKPFHLVFSW